jgi:hypothetical protein
MGNLMQAIIPAVLAFVVAYQGGLTRTSRLHSMIRNNLDLLGKLPADSPSRVKLTAHNDELVDTLIRRQRRRFEPITRAGWSFGANTAGVVVAVLGVMVAGLELAGLWHPNPEPQSQGDGLFMVAFYAALGLCFAGFAFGAWRRQQREHPKQPEPSHT